MRTCPGSPDPDAAARSVTLPASWDDQAADGLAVLVAGDGPCDLAAAAEIWLGTVVRCGGLALAAELHGLLRAQRAAPGVAAWRGGDIAEMRLNLAAFAPDETEALLDAAALAAQAAQRGKLSLTGLAGHLAATGLDYDSAAARALAAALVRRLRAHLPQIALGVVPPDAVDALLGVETAGIARAFGPLDDRGRLTRASRALLSARGFSAEQALAALLAGDNPLPSGSAAAHAAMHAALSPLLDAMPPLPASVPAPRPLVRRQELPARHGGLAHKAVVGGQKVFLRTGEYPDGRPGEIAITLPQASPAVRSLVECLSHAIGIGLQHGVALTDYVEALAGTRFGPAGAVEGDPDVARASSAIDFAMRRLAHSYAPNAALPPVDVGADEPPPLPLDLPQAPPRHRGLRVVK